MALSPEAVLELSRSLPHRPGVYLMEDGRSKVIYVGKAKDLHKRVLSYFQESREHPAKTRALVAKAARVEVVVAGSEKEALILEATLIKRHRPRYNVMLRDDKSYPLIRLTTKYQYPYLAIVRRPSRDGHRYFGPYVSATAARSTLGLLHRLLPLRKCRGPTPPPRSRPCQYHQVGQCLAPCCRPVAAETYQALVDEAVLFLSGRLKEVTARLTQEMWAAAEAERYEAAATLRDKLAAVAKTLEKQVMVASEALDRDVFGLAAGPIGLAVAVLFVRGGALVGQRSYLLKSLEAVDEAVLGQVVGQFYAGKSALPDQVLLPRPCADQELLAEWLSEVKGAKVRLILPRRGRGRALLDRAQANAASALPLLAGSPEALAAQGLEELGRRLGLAQTPASLEGYDISIHQGAHPVGAMVRFEEGRPVRSKYRNFKIKTVEGQDDFAMLAEVLKRRFKEPGVASPGKGAMPPPPDVVVMDGGKGQLAAAVAALAEAGRADQAVVALAKTEGAPDADRLFIPGRKNPVDLDKPARLLLMRLRDETHRRAVTALRQSRVRGLTKSRLLDLPGVGPRRARALLTRFGSLSGVAGATVEELARTPGLSLALARRIHELLHPSDEDQGIDRDRTIP